MDRAVSLATVLLPESGNTNEIRNETHQQCDSCKFEQLEIIDDLCALKFHTVDASTIRIRGNVKSEHIKVRLLRQFNSLTL